jgi:tetratricopeptide (TPR) repeat protein
MPGNILSFVTLPPATISSVSIYDYAIANQELAIEPMEKYYSCCGKSICTGCVYSFDQSGNGDKCPFCNSDRCSKTEEERVQEMMRRVEANDPASICMLATHYHLGRAGFQQDHVKAMELYVRAADLGNKTAHYNLANFYHEGGNMKKAKFHWEAVAMAGNKVARFNVGNLEAKFGNMERAVKHWTIAASAGHYTSMYNLLVSFNEGAVSKESIDSILAAYNSSCVEMRSEARDAFIRFYLETM